MSEAPPADCMLFDHDLPDEPTNVTMSEAYFICRRPNCNYVERRIK